MKNFRISYLLLIAPVAVSIALLGSFFIKAEPAVTTNGQVRTATAPGRIVMSTWTVANEAQAQTPTVTPTPEPTPDTQVTTPASAPTTNAKPKITTQAPKVRTSTAETVRAPAPQPAPATPVACNGSYTQEFLCLLNQYRASKGKGKLSYSSSLASVAKTHSSWMLTTGTFSHTGVDGSRFFNRCEAAGVVCRAENLALQVGSAQNLLNMWKDSSGHNANLLGPYTTIGLGISGDYTTALFN